MKLYSLNSLFTVFLIVFTLLGCNNKSNSKKASALPYYGESSFTPKWLAPNSKEAKEMHSIPNFSLINQNGEVITSNTFKNKIYVADFFFTSCSGICPKMTSNMSVLQEAFKTDNDVLLLSHTVTPETDTVEVLNEYAKTKGVTANKWHLVTGSRSEIYNLGRNAYFIEEDLGELKTNDDFLHTENFVLIDKNQHIRGIYNGLNKTAIQQLITDIKTLKEES
ncbi:SCO family protein [Cellulophaga omnivescoria]|uniref:SCO family protein n=1 Tax=Cellulophaga omnivescoria TaxID=1888890 RepID=UPI0022F023C6|nr:SCO family protein [Cellulophaga omnivescoria]WBU89027.1 SCO family protein [Cellulophaga omnivescoria]